MKRVLSALLILCFLTVYTFSQENNESPYFDAFVKNFEKSNNISTKIELLQDAADIDRLGMGKIYVMAVEYLLNDIDLINSDPLAAELAALAVRLIASINYTEANAVMWKLFTETDKTEVRVEILSTLGTSAKEDPNLADLIVQWVNGQNLLYQDAVEIDLQVFAESIVTLGKIGNQSAFPVLFSASLIGYPIEIRTKISEALAVFQGDVREHLVQVMKESPVQEKIAALDLITTIETLGDDTRAEIAIAALSFGNSAVVTAFEEKKEIIQLREKAAAILAALTWSEATPLMIKHFDLTIADYDNGIAEKQVFIDAINGLGIMGNHEAAVRLTLYIEVLNFNLENGQQIDNQIILAVVNNLGRLGDRVALDSLLYVKYLDYPNAVKKAAREAQKNLKIR